MNGVLREFTLPDKSTALAGTTSAYDVVRDSATLAFILFVRTGTGIIRGEWERIDSPFLLNIRALKASITR